jgi:peptide/nickel transport system permease protein
MIGLLILVVFAVLSIIAPWISPHDPIDQNLIVALETPGTEYWLGTDHLGRDLLSRLIYGARISLLVGASVVAVSGTFGVVMGLIAGYRGGRTDSIIMRVIDTQVAFPGLLLALVILAVLGPSVTTVIVALSINGWMIYGRITRGVVLSAKEMPYVEAAEVIGSRSRRVVFRHILPNLASPLLTLGILEFARIILAEAALSYLGLGVQPPLTSWGLDVANGQNYIFRAWWLVTFPGMAIALTVLGVNLFASWLRIIADPQEREKRFAAGAERIAGT